MTVPQRVQRGGRPWRRRRAEVLARDDYKCVRCGSLGPLEVDHITRCEDGGGDELSNLRSLCKPCHDLAGGTRLRRTPRSSAWEVLLQQRWGTRLHL